MKSIVTAVVAATLLAGAASAQERYVMVTHTQGTDPFWPVVEKGGRDAAEDVGAAFEYNYAPSGDMSDMAQLIEAAAATQPDGRARCRLCRWQACSCRRRHQGDLPEPGSVQYGPG